MATGLSVVHADAVLALLDTCYVQVHTGDPGTAGTANVLGSVIRKSVGLGTASTSGSDRVRSNTALIRWEGNESTATGTVQFATIWSDVTTGTFLRSATVASKVVTSGEPFEIPAGGVVVEQGPLAS